MVIRLTVEEELSLMPTSLSTEEILILTMTKRGPLSLSEVSCSKISNPLRLFNYCYTLSNTIRPFRHESISSSSPRIRTFTWFIAFWRKICPNGTLLQRLSTEFRIGRGWHHWHPGNLINRINFFAWYLNFEIALSVSLFFTFFLFQVIKFS